MDKQLGVVIVSVDKAMLEEIYGENKNNFTFMVDSDGMMISCYDKSLLGADIINVFNQSELLQIKRHQQRFWQS